MTYSWRRMTEQCPNDILALIDEEKRWPRGGKSAVQGSTSKVKIGLVRNYDSLGRKKQDETWATMALLDSLKGVPSKLSCLAQVEKLEYLK
jgi:hypothetical protein